MRYIYAIFGHDLNSQGVDPMRGHARTKNLGPISSEILQISLRHLRPGGIAGT